MDKQLEYFDVLTDTQKQVFNNLLNNQGAVVLGMVYNYLPFMVLPIHSVLLKIDKSVVEAAEDLGARPACPDASAPRPTSPA